MPKIETAFLGWQTVRILAGVPDAQAAWLIKALCAWILDDKEPEEIPPECIGSWIAIHDESVRIHESMKESAMSRADHARTAALARWNAQACPSMPEHAQSCPTMPNPCPTMRESKSESNNSASPNGDASIPRALACEGEASCPLDDDTIRVTASHIGMPETEVDAWRDYYTAAQWRFRPADPRVMTKAAALASLKRWHANEGLRKAREEHLDAKMDERAAKRDAARNGGGVVATSELEAMDRKRKAEEAAALAHAKELMNW